MSRRWGGGVGYEAVDSLGYATTSPVVSTVGRTVSSTAEYMYLTLSTYDDAKPGPMRNRKRADTNCNIDRWIMDYGLWVIDSLVL